MALRQTIRIGLNNQRMTPDVIAAYAALVILDDDSLPIVPAAHHWLWLRLMCDERIKRLLIISPPESAKTTWAIQAFTGCYVGFYPERSTIIGSVSGSVARRRSEALRATVMSKTWQSIFPNITQAKGLAWATTEWSVAPGGIPRKGRQHPTVTAYGTQGSIIGSRADLIIADDLLDFDSTRTSNQRSTVDQWIHNSLLSRLKSRRGRAIMIGTAWHHDDSYARAGREGGWVVCKLSSLSENNEVYARLTYPNGWEHEMMGEPEISFADS